MFKYMAFVWDKNDVLQSRIVDQLVPRLRAESAAWHCALEQPGMRVFHTVKSHSSTDVCRLQGNHGVILGALFKNADAQETVACRVGRQLPIQECAQILASKGSRLVERYWGDYVAILTHPEATGASILRSPMGRLPCQYLKHAGVRIYFSWMEDCLRLQVGRFSVNWEYFATHMIDTVPTRMTGLCEVSELQPGECIDVTPDGDTTRMCWEPRKVASTNIVHDEREAAAVLRHAVRTSVHSWAACYDSIVLTLSGGLDSSIVLGCLADAPARPRITCLTEYSPGYDSDERKFARLAVAHTKCCDHVEQSRNLEVHLEGMLSVARCAVHRGIIRRMEVSRPQARLAAEGGAGAFFSGSGGDEVFDPFSPRLSVVDYLFHHGWSIGVRHYLYESAQSESASIWRVGSAVLRQRFFPRRQDMLALATARKPMVNLAVIADLRNRFLRAQSAAAASSYAVPPGKQSHIDGLLQVEEYYDPAGFPGDAEPIVPLMSQPVIEAVLRIPTYVLSAGGLDRGLARRAFALELPPEIANRRDKGGVNEHTLAILRRNLPFLRGLMLDGVLVQRGLLDRAKLEEALADVPSRTTSGLFGIHNYISMEAWLRSWLDQAQRIAA